MPTIGGTVSKIMDGTTIGAAFKSAVSIHGDQPFLAVPANDARGYLRSCNAALASGDRMQLGRLKRREFVALLGASAAWPIAGHAQQAGKIFRSAITWANRVEALRGGLRDLGYVEEKNIVIEFRWTETMDQLPELATQLVRMNVDVIFAPSSTEVEVARQATNAIPIVFATESGR